MNSYEDDIISFQKGGVSTKDKDLLPSTGPQDRPIVERPETHDFKCVSCNAKITLPMGVYPPDICPKCGSSDGKVNCPEYSAEMKNDPDTPPWVWICPDCGVEIEVE